MAQTIPFGNLDILPALADTDYLLVVDVAGNPKRIPVTNVNLKYVQQAQLGDGLDELAQECIDIDTISKDGWCFNTDTAVDYIVQTVLTDLDNGVQLRWELGNLIDPVSERRFKVAGTFTAWDIV